MTTVVSTFVAVYLGLPSHQDVRPNFLPFVPNQPPALEEVAKHLEGQQGFSEFLKAYQKTQKDLGNETFARHAISEKLETYASMPYLKFVDNYSQTFIEKGKAIALDKAHQLLLLLFPWEMYDFFVPPLQRFGSNAVKAVQWFRTRYRDTLAEGGFLTRLEQDDFSSAGRLAHQKTQFYWQALLQESQLSTFAMQNESYAHLAKPISDRMQHYKDQYKRWNKRRVSLYQMIYIVLQARQMQIDLKLSLNLENDEYKNACRFARITFYERWINATQSAFYNRTMDEKGLSYLERAADKGLYVLEFIGTSLRLLDAFQKPPPFYECLKKLEDSLKEDTEDLKKMWANLITDPESWDLDDWILKPKTEFEKRFEAKDKKITADEFLVHLLTTDQARTAERLCLAMSNKPSHLPVWNKQLAAVQDYNQRVGKLFVAQKSTDGTLNNLVKRLDQIKGDELKELQKHLQQCQDLSLDLYNGIVSLKGSLLKSVMGNFDQQNKGLAKQMVESLTRTTVLMISEGTLERGLPHFNLMAADIDTFLTHVEKTLSNIKNSKNKADKVEEELKEFFVMGSSSVQQDPQAWDSFGSGLYNRLTTGLNSLTQSFSSVPRPKENIPSHFSISSKPSSSWVPKATDEDKV